MKGLTVNTELSNEEATLVLDALSQLPLARSYNLFNRLLRECNEAQAKSAEPRQMDLELSAAGTD